MTACKWCGYSGDSAKPCTLCYEPSSISGIVLLLSDPLAAEFIKRALRNRIVEWPPEHYRAHERPKRYHVLSGETKTRNGDRMVSFLLRRVP